jgi:hypothetical protein
MTRSRKRWWVAGLVALAFVGVELGARLARRPSTGLVLINGGAETIRGLVVSYSGVRILVGDVAPGEMKLVRPESGRDDAVTIAFEQAGNASPGATISGVELDQARRDGLRMVLTFQPGQVVRYLEEDERVGDAPPLVRLGRWLYDLLFATPPPGRAAPVRAVPARPLLW